MTAILRQYLIRPQVRVSAFSNGFQPIDALPDYFRIAVVGHRGWSRDPGSVARYAPAVTFEIQGGEITIYEPLRTAIAELQAQTEEIEAEAEIEVEVGE